MRIHSYNLVYGNLLSVPTEITAICVLFNFWTDINSSLWIVMFIILTFVVGISHIRIYGEVEFWFAMLKIVFIVSRPRQSGRRIFEADGIFRSFSSCSVW